MRRILVSIKRVVDSSIRVRVRPDGSGVATDGLKMSINPFDEVALEEALRIKERRAADEVVVVSIGSPESERELRTALAMGAGRAVLVATQESLEPLALARTLLALVERESPVLAMLGKQAIDDDQAQVGPMLAARWGRPQATFVSTLVLGERMARATREVDRGRETLELDLPAVVTADLRLNQPRYLKLPDILKAKRKPLEVVDFASLGIEPQPQFRVVETRAPPARPPGVKVDSAADLVTELRRRGTL